LFILIALGWGLSRISDVRTSEHANRTRVWYSLFAIALLICGRLFLLKTEGIALLFSPQYQDAQDFASTAGFGMLANPLELFITSFFASVASVVLWIIWMPRERIIKEEDFRIEIDDEQYHKSPATGLLMYTIAAIVAVHLLVSLLGEIVGGLVKNTSVNFLVVKQVL